MQWHPQTSTSHVAQSDLDLEHCEARWTPQAHVPLNVPEGLLLARAFWRLVCVSDGIHINVRIQGFTAEYCTVAKGSKLFIKAISSFNAVTNYSIFKLP